MKFLRNCLLILLLCGSTGWTSATYLLSEMAGSESEFDMSLPEAPPEHKEIESLIKTLENDKTRQSLVSDLRVLMAGPEKSTADNNHNTFNFIFSELLQDLINIVLDLKDQCGAFTKIFKSPTIRQILFEFVWIAALAMCVGEAGELIFLSLFNKLSARLKTKASEKLITKPQIFFVRFTVRVVSIMIYVLLAIIIMMALEPQTRVMQLGLYTVTLATLFKIFQSSLLIFIAPRTPELRLLAIKNDAAILIYEFIMIVSLSLLIGYGTTVVFHTIQAADDVIFFVVKLSTIVAGTSIIYFSYRLKPHVNRWIAHDRLIEGKSDHGFNRFIMEVARSWYPVLTAYIGLVIVVILSSNLYLYRARIGLLFNTLLMLIVTYLLVLIIPKLVRYLLYRIAEKHPLIRPRLRAYRRICSAMLLAAVGITSMIYCASLWNVTFINECMGTSNNKTLLQVLSLILILIVGMVAWEINELWTERKFSSHNKELITAEADKRLRTLQPLIRNTGRGFIVLLVSLMGFSELGLNIAPLLAALSVFGIAFSLGGQTLAKDLITGSFIVIEDTMNIGDHVEVSGHTGRIETMSLRSVTLRDSAGAVHSIPFNTITTIVNYSKTYSMCVFNFHIDLSIDKQTVIDTINDVEKTMQDEPLWAAIIIESFTIPGIISFDDGSYTLRAQIKVVPGKQWRFEREINWRFAKAFKQAGIHGPANKKHLIVEQFEPTVK